MSNVVEFRRKGITKEGKIEVTKDGFINITGFHTDGLSVDDLVDICRARIVKALNRH